MKQIAKNDYYELGYDADRNWIFWTMKGFWKNMEVVPDFYKDWEKTAKLAKPGFKIYADLSKLKTMPEDVKAAQDAQQKKLLEKGCKKVSCIMESAATKLSLNHAVKASGMDKILRYFDKPEEAGKWLMDSD